MNTFTSSPGAKRLLLHRPSYVTQCESKGQLGTLIQSWTDEQARNSILTYAKSKQTKLMVHLRSQQKLRRRRNKNNGIIIMSSWFIVIIDLTHIKASSRDIEAISKNQNQK